MRILVLEDDENRQEWFLKRFWQETVDIATSASNAIEMLKRSKYAVIFLDHDLEYQHYGSDSRDDSNTGYAVASWLAENARLQPFAQVIVHSVNPSGAPRMVSALSRTHFRAQHVPFVRLRETRIGLTA